MTKMQELIVEDVGAGDKKTIPFDGEGMLSYPRFST